jgi:two-component system chemotaxis response regulator CheY
VQLKKILVVDDSELLHKMYDLVLIRYRHEGAEVSHARNGVEALSIAAAIADLDLVLLDINMPVMNGIDVLTALRDSGRLGRLQVIMVSTEGRPEEGKKVLRMGATAMVTKPFTPSDLHAIISRTFSPTAVPTAFAADV